MLCCYVICTIKGGVDEFKNIKNKANQYVHIATKMHQQIDYKRIWYDYKNIVPELSEVALALLSIPASEASVERTFSTQGLIHTKIRNSLSDCFVQAEMTINFNKKALSKETKVIKCKIYLFRAKSTC